MDIEDWREKIDEVDTQILELINKRSEFSIKIGEIKTDKGIPIHSPEREKIIMKRMQKINPGPLSDDGVLRIFERIIDESRKLEKDIAKDQISNKKEG
ncbi:chorismate mutase [candidate division KSB1 bacterium]|nr:chorismate mutase [candidate division KSB1 bacterium]